MIAKAYRALVAFKDTLVEAYIRGTADEAWGLRHPPKAGEPVCGFCDRHVEDVEAAHARGVQEERARWAAAVAAERLEWLTVRATAESRRPADAALRCVLIRMGTSPGTPVAPPGGA